MGYKRSRVADVLGDAALIARTDAGAAYAIRSADGEALALPYQLIRRTLLRQNVTNAQASIALPQGVQRVRISYEQRVGGTAATGVALRYVLGAIGAGPAAAMLADTTARQTLVLGGTVDLLIDPAAAASPVRLDYLTTSAETGHSTLTVEYWVPPLALAGTYFACAACSQIAGDAALETVLGMQAALNSNLQGASPWAAPGYLSVPATSGDYSASWNPDVFNAFWGWSRRERLLVLLTAAWATVPTTSAGFIGNVGSAGDGWRLRTTPTGVDFSLNSAGTPKYAAAWDDINSFDTADHAIAMYLDADRKVLSGAIDGRLVQAEFDLSSSSPATATTGLRLGRSTSGALVVPAAKYRHVHIFRPAGYLSPTELTRIASRYAVDPAVMLTEGL